MAVIVKRKIGKVVLDVTLEERHTDQLQITQFPVLSGAVITDHAYKLPMTCTIKGGQGTGPGQYVYGVNPDNIITADIPNDNGQYAFNEEDSYTIAGGDVNRPTRTYNTLLALQASREPFTVITGKRMYKNMLIKTLNCTTDRDTENVLVVSADLQEIIIVSTNNYGKVADFVKPQETPEQLGNQTTNEIGKSSAKSILDNLVDSFKEWWKNLGSPNPKEESVITPTGQNTSKTIPDPTVEDINQLYAEPPNIPKLSLTEQIWGA